MDERLLDIYAIELRHLQNLMKNFRAEHEKVGARLMIDNEGRCLDPWVQRLLEGFAFLAARVHLRLDDEFPRFTQGLIETIYPDFLCPFPPMGIFEFHPQRSVPDLMAGREIPRDTAIKNTVEAGPASLPVVEFRTAHPVQLWSLSLTESRFEPADGESLALPQELGDEVRSALRLRLRNEAQSPIAKVEAKFLDIYIAADGEARAQLIELLVVHCCGLVVYDPASSEPKCLSVSTVGLVSHLGFSAEESLLPADHRTFSGYRLLREYFALPDRLAFFRISGFAEGIQRSTGREAEVVLLFRREAPSLGRLIGSDSLKLYCTPAINLFPHPLERVALDHGVSEIQLISDRFGPLNYEVHRVKRVEGLGDQGRRCVFRPFFESRDRPVSREGTSGDAYYTVRRSVRATTEREREENAARAYAGTELFLTLVDGSNAPYANGLRQLAVQALCSNRHLAKEIPAPVWAEKLVTSPSPPYLARVSLLGGISDPQMPDCEGQTAWQFINQLALDLGDLGGTEPNEAMLADVLRLHAPPNSVAAQAQISGLRAVRIRAIVRPIEDSPVMAFVRGFEVTLELDESVFRRHSAILFGAVVERFLARHVAMNSFTETVLWSQQRKQEIMRWTARPGNQSAL